MNNSWESINLDKYEKHMSLDSVKQLQALNFFMNKQLNMLCIKSIMILGIAGGNGLEHIDTNQTHKVYGVDINQDYLIECKRRYINLENILECICIDLTAKNIKLPYADTVIADLIIEYLGYKCFQNVINVICPKYVSCVIQINTGNNFVSSSPYSHIFDNLESIHTDITEEGLTKTMKEINYYLIDKEQQKLPNEKHLIMLTYKK